MIAAVPLGYFLFGAVPRRPLWVGALLVIGAGLPTLERYRRAPATFGGF
jgi:hypothetical protein